MRVELNFTDIGREPITAFNKITTSTHAHVHEKA